MERVTAAVQQFWRDRERLRDLVIDANDGIVAIENPESTCSPQQMFNGWLSLSGVSFPAG